MVKSLTASGDPDIKRRQLAPPAPADIGLGGESIANKGEVTGVDQRPKSPAERLALAGTVRAKAEKCLANAVYFEARGEAGARADRGGAGGDEPGVLAVLSERCLRRRLPERQPPHLPASSPSPATASRTSSPSPTPGLRAKRIARDMLDGKLWMPQVAKSTHYHAYWVHPDWVNEMKQDLQARRAHLLSPARLGRRRR